MKRDIWGNCRKNLLFLRKYYNLTQQQVADGANISRSAYFYAENVNPMTSFSAPLDFWSDKCFISPDELLLRELSEGYLKNREKIAIRNFLRMLDEKFK